ncbi:DUF58 domain-containing protein [Gemmata sp. JC717]|uniref:DUF58 domain-containing protein n=1 Tax=Gemmata algarum TaxID=2975278 RepID=UPI0021BB7B8A|nr:DUF58 domain-containing protein [Gemmata algarum]MDY3555611.1 DUF58 domain-containing protein [Gemmata algarum]
MPAPAPTPTAANRPPSGGPALIDPAALMRIKSLQLRARVIVEGFEKGLHRSPYHGFSAEFSEYRQYTPGDDPRYLDWRLFARSDRYYIKKFEDETNLRCHLIADGSRSMGYGSGPVTKWDYARTAAATVAYFLSRQRDAVGLVTFADRVVEYIPPRARPGQLAHLTAALHRDPGGTATDLVGPLGEAGAVTRRRGLFVLFSDLLVPASAVRTAIGGLRAAGHDVIVFRVLDPQEVHFRFDAPGLFRDAETGREVFVDPRTAADEYRARFAAHAADVRQECTSAGADFEQITTDRPLELVLFDLLRARARRGRAPARSAQNRGGGR